MKRIFTAMAACMLLLTGCGAGDENVRVSKEKIIYLPSDTQMKSALDEAGYQTALIGDFDKDGYSILSATNGKTDDEFDGVMVMRAEKAEDINAKHNRSGSAEVDQMRIYAVTDDPTLGNLLITGTDKAIKTAGIKTG